MKMPETQSYLSDFSKRLTSLAIPYKLAQYAENKVKDYRKSSITNEMFYNLIHFVLLYIEQQNISKKDCTKEDIANELKLVCSIYNIEVDCYELTRDIINHCLENNGERQYFDSSQLGLPVYEIRLLKGDNIFKDGKYITRYELTPQGVNYIYFTKEILEFGQVDIEHIKLQKSIKMGNYNQARHNVDSLLIALENQRKEIEENRRKIISNIFEIDIKSILDDTYHTYEMIKDQRNETSHILELLKEHVSTNQALVNSNIKSALVDISYVENKIIVILGKQFELLQTLQEFNKTLNEELIDASFLAVHNNLNILEDIIKPLQNDIIGDINPFLVLRAMFGSSNNEYFDIQKIFEEQAIIGEKPDSDIDVEDVDFTDTDNSEETEKRNTMYEKIFVDILNHIDMNNETSLSHILKMSDILTEDINCSKVVLTNLIMREEIVFDDMKSFDAGGDLEYFAPECLHKNSNLTLSGRKLRIYSKDRNDEISIVEKSDGKNLIKNSLRLPNLFFLVVGEE
jgi:hypothetical protein